jgi:hypothetical protein
VESAEGAKGHAECFRTFLELPPGIPSPDTCTRVFALRQPTTRQAGLRPWWGERRGGPGRGFPGRGNRCGIRGGPARSGKRYLWGSAWAGQTGLTRGQVAVDANSHEITALPQLLKVLDLRDKMVTRAARGWQKESAQTMGEGEGDDSWAGKAHQPTWPAESPAACTPAAPPPAGSPRLSTTAAQGHGREEQRTGQGLPARGPLSAAPRAAWRGATDCPGHPRGVVGGDGSSE